MTARELRLLQGTAAVLSVSMAARLLPWRAQLAERWLRSMGLVREVWLEDDGGGRKAEVVVWGKVIDAIEAGSVPAELRHRETDDTERLDLGL